MRYARVVEMYVATFLAAVAGATAFLLLPLDFHHTRAPFSEKRETRTALATLSPTSSPRVNALPSAPPLRVPPTSWLDLLPPPATASAVIFAPDALRPLPPPTRGSCATLSASEHASFIEGASGDVLFLLGTERHAVGDLAAAADYYEAFARNDLSRDDEACSADEKAMGLCVDAPRALETAIALRRGLGDEERAQELSVRYVATYGETRISDAARVSLVAGRALTAAGRAEEARRHLSAHTRRFARHVPIGERVRGWVARGQAEREAGDERAALRSFRLALSLWDRGGASVAAMRLDEEGQELGSDFARSLDAVAEAGFHLAEARYGRFAALTPPRYVGHGSRREVERWVSAQLRPWMVEKLRALSRAETAYRRVAALGVTRHRIAAEARRGAMYRDLLETLAGAPTIVVHEQGELGIVVEADWRSAPVATLRARATEAFRACLETALQTRQLGHDAALCAAELSRVDPMRYPPQAELSPAELLLISEPVGTRPVNDEPSLTEACSS